jgi:hypothetical protein
MPWSISRRHSGCAWRFGWRRPDCMRGLRRSAPCAIDGAPNRCKSLVISTNFCSRERTRTSASCRSRSQRAGHGRRRSRPRSDDRASRCQRLTVDVESRGGGHALNVATTVGIEPGPNGANLGGFHR